MMISTHTCQPSLPNLMICISLRSHADKFQPQQMKHCAEEASLLINAGHELIREHSDCTNKTERRNPLALRLLFSYLNRRLCIDRGLQKVFNANPPIVYILLCIL